MLMPVRSDIETKVFLMSGHFSIKKVSGLKTDIAFQRYNLVTEEEMLGMKWLDLKKDEHRTMDTYMDTKAL